MNPEAKCYFSVEGATKIIAEVLKEQLLNLPFCKGECIADAGCGPGKITKDVLLSTWPEQVEKVFAFDSSENMILEAKKINAHPKIEYVVADLNKRSSFPIEWKGKFSKVFSSYCLHWVNNMKIGFQNIHYILRPGGHLAASVVVKSSLWTAAGILRQKPEWMPYCHKSEEGIPSIHYNNEPKATIEQWLVDSGFEVIFSDLRTGTHELKNLESLKEILQSLASFYVNIPEALKSKYIEEYAEEMLKVTKGKYGFPGDVVIVIARAKQNYSNGYTDQSENELSRTEKNPRNI